jgi:hypothetical protein
MPVYTRPSAHSSKYTAQASVLSACMAAIRGGRSADDTPLQPADAAAQAVSVDLVFVAEHTFVSVS